MNVLFNRAIAILRALPIVKFVIVLIAGLGGAIATWPLVRTTRVGRWLGSREVAEKSGAGRTLGS
jgi:hypothetical protein